MQINKDGLCEIRAAHAVKLSPLCLLVQITILLKDVTSMTKEKTAKLIPNAIQISTDNEKVRVKDE